MRRWLCVAVVLAAVVVGCGRDESKGTTGVVVDGDGAFDDIKALVYLLDQPDVEVLAVTVSGTGIAHCPSAAENTAAMLERIGVSGVPVACGRTTPLEGSNSAPEAWRNAVDTLGGVDLPAPPDLGDVTAVEMLTDTISGADSVVLVALGPFTNIAEAFEADPSLVEHIEMIYAMGGAVDVGGNVLYANPAAEFNIWADPHAAAVVFDSDVPISLIPLDATNALPVTPFLYEAVAAHRAASPVAEFVADYLDATPLYGGLYHWDELAAVAATDESVVTFEDRSLEIVESGGPLAGATVESATGRSVRVAVAADRQRFADRFYRAIIGTSDPGVPEWEPDATVTWDGATCRYAGPDPLPSSMWIRIDNESTEMVGLLTGRYAPGTTSEDWSAYVASGATDPPEWWQPNVQIPVPGGAHEVWPITAGSGVTAICYVDETRSWELAGPRLSG
jgi:pyrimidine-specific ribonucleoside hydrolase